MSGCPDGHSSISLLSMVSVMVLLAMVFVKCVRLDGTSYRGVGPTPSQAERTSSSKKRSRAEPPSMGLSGTISNALLTLLRKQQDEQPPFQSEQARLEMEYSKRCLTEAVSMRDATMFSDLIDANVISQPCYADEYHRQRVYHMRLDSVDAKHLSFDACLTATTLRREVEAPIAFVEKDRDKLIHLSLQGVLNLFRFEDDCGKMMRNTHGSFASHNFSIPSPHGV